MTEATTISVIIGFITLGLMIAYAVYLSKLNQNVNIICNEMQKHIINALLVKRTDNNRDLAMDYVKGDLLEQGYEERKDIGFASNNNNTFKVDNNVFIVDTKITIPAIEKMGKNKKVTVLPETSKLCKIYITVQTDNTILIEAEEYGHDVKKQCVKGSKGFDKTYEIAKSLGEVTEIHN